MTKIGTHSLSRDRQGAEHFEPPRLPLPDGHGSDISCYKNYVLRLWHGGEVGAPEVCRCHPSGVYKCKLNACKPDANSSANNLLTRRWRATGLRVANAFDTAMTLKWVSDPTGTLWRDDSFSINRGAGLIALNNTSYIRCSRDIEGRSCVKYVEVYVSVWKSIEKIGI